MAKPSKIAIDSIEKCLQDMVKLCEQTQPTELPNTIRQRGKAVLNRIFSPDTISEVNITTLKKELELIKELQKNYKNFDLYSLLSFARDCPEEIEKLYKYSLGQMELITPEEYKAFQIEQQKQADHEFRMFDAFVKPKKKRVIVNKTIGKNGETVVSKVTQYIDSPNKDLNGEPNPFAYRDQGRYGSHSLHDNYDDESTS